MVWFLLWEKGSIYFLYIIKYFPPKLADPAISEAAFKDCVGLVLLTSVQEPKVASKRQKPFLHVLSKIYTFFLCTKFLL